MTDDGSDALRGGVALDLDGTLVDSVYLHVLAWVEAIVAAGETPPPHVRVHQAIGMGSDRLLQWTTGRPFGPDDSQAIAADHDDRFLARAELLRATPGARALVDDLGQRGVPFVIATSSSGKVLDTLLGVLDLTPGDLDVATGEDVERTKPAVDPVLAACDRLALAPDRVAFVGDSRWDAEAAARAGAFPVGVRCGGNSTEVLLGAGARLVVDTPVDLLGRL